MRTENNKKCEAGITNVLTKGAVSKPEKGCETVLSALMVWILSEKKIGIKLPYMSLAISLLIMGLIISTEFGVRTTRLVLSLLVIYLSTL